MTIDFNLVVVDQDSDGSGTRAALWHETGSAGPYFSGEIGWKVKLHLGAIGLQVPYRKKPPVLDGVIGPEEYGPPVDVEFTDGANPGRLTGQANQKRGAHLSLDDLSYRVFSAHDDRSLLLAVRVNDDILVRNAPEPWSNDWIVFFFDSDRVSNDYSYSDSKPTGVRVVQSREGFELGANIRGVKLSSLTQDWSCEAKDAPGGYGIEFRIPLNLFDVRDGAGEVSAGSGSTIRFNLHVNDNDDTLGNDLDLGCLWLEDWVSTLFASGESSWLVDLHLARPVRYELVKGPAGATLDPDSGVFRWTPPPGGVNVEVKFRVFDTQNPVLSDIGSFLVKGDGSALPTIMPVGPDSPAPPTAEGLLPPRLVIGEILPDEVARPLTSAVGAGKGEPPAPPKREAGLTTPPIPPRGEVGTAERTRRRESYDKIGLAYQAWLDQAEARALKILEEIPVDHRGWEWGYCRRSCRRAMGPDPPPSVGQPRRNLKDEFVWEDAHSLILFLLASSDSVAISDDGRYVCGGSLTGMVRVWDSEQWDHSDLGGYFGTVSPAVAFSPGGARGIASGGHDRVKVWDRPSGKLLTDFDHGDEVYCVAFSPDGRRIASGGKGSRIRLWDLGPARSTPSSMAMRGASGRWPSAPTVGGSPRARRTTGFASTTRPPAPSPFASVTTPRSWVSPSAPIAGVWRRRAVMGRSGSSAWRTSSRS